MLRSGPGIVAACVLQLAAALTAAQIGPQAVLSHKSVYPGGLVHIAVSGVQAREVAATFVGETIPLDFEGARGAWDTLIGIDLDTKPGTYAVTVAADGQALAPQTLRVLPKTFRVRQLRVAPDYVDPPPDTLERIAAEAKTLASIFATRSPRKYSGPFALPVDGVPTSNFGSRSVYNGSPRSPHAGIDFSGAIGTPIRASNHGVVVLAEPLYFTGNTVIIDYGSGLHGLFAHMSELKAAPGDLVAPDSIIGLVGATGRVTGPHLHWSIRLHGARVDPVELVAVTRN